MMTLVTKKPDPLGSSLGSITTQWWVVSRQNTVVIKRLHPGTMLAKARALWSCENKPHSFASLS